MWDCGSASPAFDPASHYANCETLLTACQDAYNTNPPVPLGGSPNYNAVLFFAMDVGNECKTAWNFIEQGGYAQNYNPAYLAGLVQACGTLQIDATSLAMFDSNSAAARALFSIICSTACSFYDPFNVGYAPLANPFGFSAMTGLVEPLLQE